MFSLMKVCFRHWIKKIYIKKVIATFYLTILIFFTEMWDINSQLQVKESYVMIVMSFDGWGGTDMFSELPVYITQLWLYFSELQV